jgi:hypothetical protein
MDDGDGAFGSPFDAGPVVPDPVDVDDVVVDVGPAVDVGVDSFDGPVEVGPTVGVPLDEDDADDRPLEAGPALDGGPVEVGPTVDGGGPAEVGPTLRRVFERDYDVVESLPELERFPPLRIDRAEFDAQPHINDPMDLDVDAACFMMLTSDLSSLFGIMARPANRVISVRDSPEFADWLHVISDPVVVRVYAGSTEDEVRRFRDEVIELLRTVFGLTLTPSRDVHLLSRNQVNVPISALSDCVHAAGARICRVSFFGMKWDLCRAEPIIDHYIGRYREQMGSSVPDGKNSFDYGARVHTPDLLLLGISEAQVLAHMYRDLRVHEMCDSEGFGSVSLTPLIDARISRVKLYQEICHEIMSVVQRQMLDDMPSTVRTMRTRARQLRELVLGWDSLSPDERSSRLGGIRIEVTVQTETVRDGRYLSSSLDLFRVAGIEAALQGGFRYRLIEIEEFLDSCHLALSSFEAAMHGTNDRAPSIRIQSALTFARQSIGWSGKYMEQQLRAARRWRDAERLQVVARQESEFKYDGWEMDAEDERPLIQDFLDHAQWFLFSTVRDRSIPGLMLMRSLGRGYLPKTGIYTDRVGAARHYTRLFGVSWREHIRSIG